MSRRLPNPAPLGLCLLALAAPGAAAAEPPPPPPAEAPAAEPSWQPSVAMHFYGLHGLTGCGTMVDGQIPAPLLAAPATGDPGPLGTYSLRFGLHAGGATQSRRYRGRFGRYRITRERRGVTAIHGLTVRGLDLAIGVPYGFASERTEVEGIPGRADEDGESLGEVTIAAKVGLRVPKFLFGDWAIAGVGFYALGHLDTRLPASGATSVEYGVAITGPYGYGVRYIANVAVQQDEGGQFTLVGRAGAAAVPYATEDLTVRAYGHFVGNLHEGIGLPAVDIELGAQALVGGWLLLFADTSYRIQETSFVERSVVRALREVGDRSRTTAGEGAFAVTVGIGVLL